MNWQLFKACGVQCFIALDQIANALIPPLGGTGTPILERRAR